MYVSKTDFRRQLDAVVIGTTLVAGSNLGADLKYLILLPESESAIWRPLNGILMRHA